MLIFEVMTELGKTLILDAAKIDQKLERIVHEVHEQCFAEDEIIICGIAGNGIAISQYIGSKLEEISDIKVRLAEIIVDKNNPAENKVTGNIASHHYRDKVVIMVDDVSNSGKTLMYALKYFLYTHVKALRTLVLVDRAHNRYPVRIDFTGLTLSTTLRERIEVSLDEKDKGIYLV